MNKFFIEIFNRESRSIDNESTDTFIFNEKNLKISFSKNKFCYHNPSKNNNYFILSSISSGDKKRIIKKYDFINIEKSDSEILLDLYLRFGSKIFKIFGSSFFFFYFDFDKKNALIARDHIGFNSIYYTKKDDSLFISSSLNNLKKNCGKNLKINYSILKKFLNLDAFSKDQTFYKNILKLPPSNVLEYKNNSISIFSYPKFKDLTLSDSNTSQIEDLKKKLKKAIIRKEELKEDRVGFLFSGGIDSSTILSFFSKYDKNNRALYAYAAKFNHIEDSIKNRIDESEFQAEIFNTLNVKDRSFETEKLSTISNLDFYLDLIGQPFFFPNLYLSHEAFKKAKIDGVTKVLNGCDGDTVVSHGFEYFEELFLRLKWFKLYKQIDMLSKNVNLSKRSIFKRTVLNLLFYEKKLYFSAKNKHKQILSTPIHSNSIEVESLIADYYGVDEVYPFYNIDLMNYCINVKPELKINKYPRYILREAIKGIVPEKIRKRTDKANLTHGLIYSFLNHDKNIIERHLNNPHQDLKKVFDVSDLKKSWSKLLDNPKKYSTFSMIPSQIFAYVVVNRWFEKESLR